MVEGMETNVGTMVVYKKRNVTDACYDYQYHVVYCELFNRRRYLSHSLSVPLPAFVFRLPEIASPTLHPCMIPTIVFLTASDLAPACPSPLLP
jgi:hypothetical protein